MRNGILARCAAAALFAAQPAFAQITPEEVLQKWKEDSADSSMTLTMESEQRSGDTLMINGATYTRGVETIVIPKVALKDLGDGTVEVSVPEAIVLNTTGLRMIEIATPAMKIIVSGTSADKPCIADARSEDRGGQCRRQTRGGNRT
jgi:hypothetical protein